VSKHCGDVASSLIDRGANGGLAGSDTRVISVDPSRKLTITGIDNHQMPDPDVMQARAYVTSHKGPVIAIFHQYAHIKTGASIHSSLQLEHYKLQVDDRSLCAGGTQSISTPEGYMFPLDIIDGLVYLRMRPFTDEEYAALPHVPFTSLRCHLGCHCPGLYHLRQPELARQPQRRRVRESFRAQGNYLHRDHGETMDDIITTDVNYIAHSTHLDSILCCKSHTRPAKRDLEAYRKFFTSADVDTIHNTYNTTTQWARQFPQHGETIRNTFKSPFPAYNVDRRNEPVSCDGCHHFQHHRFRQHQERGDIWRPRLQGHQCPWYQAQVSIREHL
jgi:hypothetical protein